MRFLLLALVMLIAACEPADTSQQPQNLPLHPLAIIKQDGQAVALRVQVADDAAKTTKGLMWRRQMPELHGMLFIFPRAAVQSFWMKDTLIPLDMLFIGDKGQIVHIHQNAAPRDLSGISSRFPVTQVLEINGGLAAKWGVQVGDHVTVAKPAQSQ